MKKGVVLLFLSTLGFSSEVITTNEYTPVEVSLTDVNRIVCPVKVEGVIYSKEKAIDVKRQKNNVWVKILPYKEGEKVKYPDYPRELFVECGGQVFSLLLIPKKIPSKTIYLKPKYWDFKNARKFEENLPYEKLIVKLIKYAYIEYPPDGYKVKEVNERVKRFSEGKLILRKKYEGYMYEVREYVFIANKKTYLSEKALIPYLPANTLAISVETLSLEKGSYTRIFVVVRKDA